MELNNQRRVHIFYNEDQQDLILRVTEGGSLHGDRLDTACNRMIRT